MKKILLIIGHLNVKFNSIVALRGNTGAPDELRHNVEIGDRLCSVLRAKGFDVTETDANANDDPIVTKTDYDLALAIHCDMDTQGDSGGGMIASGDKSVDEMWAESKRIKDIIESVYFPETKIVNKGFTTDGMTKYYMWKYLTGKTPCVLLEMGQSVDPHDSVLLNNIDLIANSIAMSVCKAFDVPFEAPVPDQHLAEIIKLNEKITALETSMNNLRLRIVEMEKMVETKDELIYRFQSEVESANIEKQKALADVEYYKPYKALYENKLKETVDKYTGKQLLTMAIKKILSKK